MREDLVDKLMRGIKEVLQTSCADAGGGGRIACAHGLKKTMLSWLGKGGTGRGTEYNLP